MIVCLGWGSLCWDPRNLPLSEGPWRLDGPSIPIEFTRVSNDERVTLVITPGAASLPVLWKEMSITSVEEAIVALAERERIKDGNIQYSVGFWSEARQSAHSEVEIIKAWARDHDIDAVVWTALKPRFEGESGRTPDINQVIQILDGLHGEIRQRAEEYVRKAPRQIATAYRAQIEDRLGWIAQDL